MFGSAQTDSVRPSVVVANVKKEAEEKAKSITGSFLDFNMRGLSNETRISTKLLTANKGWVYRNNDVIAKEVATIEFELFTIKTVGNEIVYTPVIQNPLLDILDRFNEFTSASDGFYITQSHRKLAGDCFWYVEGKGANIKNIFILPPDKVTIDLGKEKGSMRIIQSYTYEDSINGKHVKQVYKPEEIIHFKVPNPNNYYRGFSAVEAAAAAIDSDNMAIEANMKLFERGLIANFMLSTEKSLTDDQLKQLHAEYRNTYGGIENAYKIPIFGGGIKPASLQMSNRDAQFLEQQEWLRDKIASLFGNNKAVLGVTDDVNRANADATIIQWKRTTIRSEMKGITDTLNEFLVPRFGDNLVLGFKDPVPEDETEKITKAKDLKGADIVTLNEAREILSLDPVEGGDEFSFQRNERRQDQIINKPPAPLKYVKLTGVLRKSGVYKQIDEFFKTKEAALPAAKKIVEAKKAAKKPFATKTNLSVDKIEKYYEKQMHIVDAIEDVFQQRVEKFINGMVDKALDQVPAEIKDIQNKQLLNEDELLTQATIDFTPLLMDVAAAAGGEAMNLINSSKPYIPTEIRSEVEAKVKLFATSMIDTDKGKLIDIITDGVRAGQSIPEIQRNITDTFASYSKMQAERIARTEVLRTSTLSSIDAWKQSGVVVAKEWLVAPNAGPECEEYNGKIIPLTKNFYSTSEFADGDPPIHPNCRCVVLPVLENERSVAKDVKIKQLQTELADVTKYAEELEELVDEEA